MKAGFFFATILTALMVSPFVNAAEPNTLTADETKDGWKLLFDGKTLDGWMSWKTKKPLEEGTWTVEDGTLTLTGKGGGDIYTVDSYENFELALEWKTTGNSGIFFRVDPAIKGPIYKVAPEIQIERTAGNHSTSAAGLYALYEVEGEKELNPDGWNQVRMRIQDGHAVHWFNGRKTYQYTIGSADWNTRVANSKFKTWEGFGEFADGRVGLQDHGAKVAFRSVKIKRLDAE